MNQNKRNVGYWFFKSKNKIDHSCFFSCCSVISSVVHISRHFHDFSKFALKIKCFFHPSKTSSELHHHLPLGVKKWFQLIILNIKYFLPQCATELKRPTSSETHFDLEKIFATSFKSLKSPNCTKTVVRSEHIAPLYGQITHSFDGSQSQKTSFTYICLKGLVIK